MHNKNLLRTLKLLIKSEQKQFHSKSEQANTEQMYKQLTCWADPTFDYYIIT